MSANCSAGFKERAEFVRKEKTLIILVLLLTNALHAGRQNGSGLRKTKKEQQSCSAAQTGIVSMDGGSLATTPVVRLCLDYT